MVFVSNVGGGRVVRRVFAALWSLVAVFAVAVPLLLPRAALPAWADNDSQSGSEERSALQQQWNDYAVQSGGEVDQRATLEKMRADTDGNSIGYALARLLSPRYMNATPLSAKNPHDVNCDAGDARNGTLTYHNCDVPNIAGEALQDAFSFFAPSGIIGGETASNTLSFPSLGLPSDLPGGGAPANPGERQAKYTALELYGYNLRYTSYVGEWDHIKVLTAARSLSNYGWMDKINLGVTAVINGVTGAVSTATSNAAKAFSKGDLIGGIASFYTGLFSGGAGASANTLLDASDQNTLDLYAWYRVGYGATLYGGRELTTEEIGARGQQMLIDAINGGRPDAAKTPDDLMAIRDLPAMPADDIALCVVTKTDGSVEERLHSDVAPGPTEAACKAEQKSVDRNKKAKWSADGNGKKETLADWRARNGSLFKTAEKYGISIPYDADESKRADTIKNMQAGWADKWQQANTTYLAGAQGENNNRFVSGLLASAVKKAAAENPDANYNAPWNRFVCTDADGRDVLDADGRTVNVYKSDGTVNPQCGHGVRSPIQNGLFGNGYLPSQAQPVADSRLMSPDDVVGVLFGLPTAANAMANTGLAASGLVTRVSNAAIGLAYSPILDSLNVSGVIVKTVEIIRDGLYFPLLVLSALVALCYALFRGLVTGAVSVVKMALVTLLAAVFGATLLVAPAALVRVVDYYPAKADAAITSFILSTGNSVDNNLCTASNGNASHAGDSSVNSVGGDWQASTAVRTLMCENWRAFYFGPYVQAQWGASYDELYAYGYAPDGGESLSNTNADLVGDAAVNMGGGVTERNWALFQVDAMGSGTASHEAASTSGRAVNPDLYRVVDAQAGLLGSGYDSRHFAAWKSGGSLSWSGVFAPVVAIAGSVTVVAYSVAKITVTFTAALMLLLLPFMLLVALHPTVGWRKFTMYAGNVAGLMIQRVILGMMLAVMLRILVTAGNSGVGGGASMLFALIVCVLFMMERRTILNVTGELAAGLGGVGGVGAGLVRDPFQVRSTGTGFIANKAQQARVAVVSAAGGFVAGTVSARGDVREGLREAGSAMSREGKQLFFRQRRRGFAALQTAEQVSSSVGAKYREDAMQDKHVQHIVGDQYRKTREYREYEQLLDAWNELSGRVLADGDGQYKLVDGERRYRPEPPKRSDVLADRSVRRTVMLAAKDRRSYVESQNAGVDAVRSKLDKNRDTILVDVDAVASTAAAMRAHNEALDRGGRLSKARIREVLEQSRADIARLDAEQDRLLERDAQRQARAEEREAKGHRQHGKWRDGDLRPDDAGSQLDDWRARKHHRGDDGDYERGRRHGDYGDDNEGDD